MSDEQIERAKITMIIRTYMSMFIVNVSLFFSNLYTWCKNAAIRILKWISITALALMATIILIMSCYAVYMMYNYGLDGSLLIIGDNLTATANAPVK